MRNSGKSNDVYIKKGELAKHEREKKYCCTTVEQHIIVAAY